MVADRAHGEIPSYFIECLSYGCPDEVFGAESWTGTTRAMLLHMWENLQGAEPTQESLRWREVNECFFLFHEDQKWTRAHGREFAQAAWRFLGFK